jgi:hypothetical protein
MAQSVKNSKKAAARRAAKGVAERVRLGEDAYTVKHTVSKGAWKQIVKGAHARGFTVPSYLSNSPDELKARTHTSLKADAKKMVAEAFTGASKQLDFQGQQAESLRQRRLEDARAYNQWAAQQQSLSAAAATTAQQNYLDFIDKQSKTAQATADQLTAQANAVASQGVSGDASGSTVIQGLKERLQAQAQAAQNNANAGHAAAPVNEERGAAIRASLQGQYANITSEAENDYSKSMSDVTAARLKLTTDEAQAVIDNYTKLLDKEIDKANANRDFEGLMAQLNEKTAARQQEHQEFLTGQKTTRRGQTLSAATTKRGQDKAANTAANAQKLSHQDRVADRRQRALDNRLNRTSQEAITAQKIAAADRTNATKVAAANTKVTAVIDTIADILRTQQRGKGGHTGSGYLWDADEQKWRPARQVLINRGATAAQINAGLAHARGQLLTPQQKAAVGIVG